MRFGSNTEVKKYKQAIKLLLDKGVIEECRENKKQFLSSYFLVPKPDGSYRFILNLKKLNEFIKNSHFKMENIRTATGLISPGYYMSNIGLEDAYFLVPVHAKSRKYLRFEFLGKLYEFTCLPNGLSTCPLIFTKVLKPVINYLRAKGFFSVIYLDDILCIAKTAELCHKNVKETSVLLTDLGFLINTRKSNLTPSTRCKYLGFIIDSVQYTVEITGEKRIRLKEIIENC